MSYINDATPPPCRKKEFRVASESDHWNYLTGAGPSAPPKTQADLPKEASWNKPSGWKSKKPFEAIDPHRQSIERNAHLERRKVEVTKLRAANQFDKQHQGGINPISGEEMFNPPRNPAHPHARQPVPTYCLVPPEVVEAKQKSTDFRQQLRTDRIVSEGLAPGSKGNRVKDNFNHY